MVYNIMPRPDPKTLAKLANLNKQLVESQKKRDEGYEVPSLAHLAVRTIDPKDVPPELKEVANRARKGGRKTKRRKNIK